MSNMYDNVIAEIVEQPQFKSMRFRYISEGPTAGSLMGVNSTEDLKTYPAIRVNNYDGAARVIVSCVTDEKTPKPHPNSLIGSKWCRQGVCCYDFTTQAAMPTIINFKRVGIQRAKKQCIKASLEEREKQRIDPFKTGFDHKLSTKSIDVHRVCLCFQVFLIPDPAFPKRIISLKPVVSDPIIDKQSVNMLLYIHEMSDNCSTPSGNKKIMLFCNKVDKNDIGIKFYERDDEGKIVWEDWGSFKPHNVHKQVAISFTTPKYRVQDIDSPVKVSLCLQTLTGKQTYSNSVEFQYVPNPNINTKKRKIGDSRSFYEYLESNNRDKSVMNSNNHRSEADCAENVAPELFNFVASNFDVSNNNLMLPTHNQTYENVNPQSQYEQRYQPSQKSDFHRSSSQPLQPLQTYNIQPQQVHCQKTFNDPQCQQYSYQQQYQPVVQPQNEIAPNYGAYSSQHSHHRYLEVENVYGATNNSSSNNIANCHRQSQPIQNYQTPVEPTQYPYRQVYAADKVVIQQFCNNNVTFNQHQRQNVSEILPNLSDYCIGESSDQNLL